MTSDFSVKGISTLAPRGGLFPFSSSCSQGDAPKPGVAISRKGYANRENPRVGWVKKKKVKSQSWWATFSW